AHRTLAPHFEADTDRITIDGPSLRLSPQAGTAMVLILHELATNAAKYGALSAPGGKLTLRWRLGDDEDQGKVCIDWTEFFAVEITDYRRLAATSKHRGRCNRPKAFRETSNHSFSRNAEQHTCVARVSP